MIILLSKYRPWRVGACECCIRLTPTPSFRVFFPSFSPSFRYFIDYLKSLYKILLCIISFNKLSSLDYIDHIVTRDNRSCGFYSNYSKLHYFLLENINQK